jgi:thiosulfate/3-mercaptopyruvate sulfurtransferase
MEMSAVLALRIRQPFLLLTLLTAGCLLDGWAAKLTAAEDRSEASKMLIQAEELEKRLQEPGLRVLDARKRDDYLKGHIRGAVWVDVKSWQSQGSKAGGFQDAKAWSEKVGNLGIAKDTVVVVHASSLPDAGRIWWLLKYLGHKNALLLDGGWELWKKQERPSDTEQPTIKVVQFDPHFQADRLEEIDALKKCVQLGKDLIIDTRSTAEFTGEEVRGKRGGHIPGAKLLEWKELLARDGRFKSPDELRSLFRRRGIEPDQTAVTY